MALDKHKFRELLLQILFSLDYSTKEERQEAFLLGLQKEEAKKDLGTVELVNLMMEQIKTTKKNTQEALQYCHLILGKKDLLDEKISQVSDAYDLDRITKVEMNILRLCLYQMLFDNKIPPKVAIAEGIRLCRKFATKESANFINAILDKIYKKEENSEYFSKKEIK